MEDGKVQLINYQGE